MTVDCREKYASKAYPWGFRRPKDELNPYWEGNLDEKGKKFIQAYDCAVEDMDNFFEHNTFFKLRGYLGDYGITRIDKNVMADQRPIDNFSTEEIAKMSMETYLLKAVHTALGIVLESTRNHMIVGFLDDPAEE